MTDDWRQRLDIWMKEQTEENQSREEASRREYARLEALRTGSPEQQAEFCATCDNADMVAFFAAMRRWKSDKAQRKERYP